MLRHFNPSDFAGVVLDESSILKAYDGKTRTAIIEAFKGTLYRLACTATPAPNDYMELGNHSEFLGVMSRVEMFSKFFVHDGGKTQKWRLKGHAREIFWGWLCSWSAMVRQPSDLGYADGEFKLRPFDVHRHTVVVDHKDAWSSGTLFALEARTLHEQRAVRRASLSKRVALCADLVNASTDSWLVWCNLNAEGDELARQIGGSVQVSGSDPIETKEDRLLGFASGKYRVLVTKPTIAGHGMNWQHCAHMAFVGVSHSWEQWYQAIRRCWRFGQKRKVHVHVITSDVEDLVVANLARKEQEAERMADEMAVRVKDVMRREVQGLERQKDSYRAVNLMKTPQWLVGGAR
jgi:hypothetical protein